MEQGQLQETLASARTVHGLTQEELASKLNVTRSAVSQWETGETSPSGASRQLLAITFGVPLAVVDSWFAVPEPQAVAS